MCCWHPYCAVGVPADAFSGILVVVSIPSAVDAVMFLLSLLLFGLPPCCCQLHFLCKHPCFYWHPYCIGGPVVAFIPAVACVPAVVSGLDIAVVLNVARVVLLLLLVSLLLLASWMLQAFLLLLAFLALLLFLSNMLLLYILDCRMRCISLPDYRTIAIGL